MTSLATLAGKKPAPAPAKAPPPNSLRPHNAPQRGPAREAPQRRQPVVTFGGFAYSIPSGWSSVGGYLDLAPMKRRKVDRAMSAIDSWDVPDWHVHRVDAPLGGPYKQHCTRIFAKQDILPPAGSQERNTVSRSVSWPSSAAAPSQETPTATPQPAVGHEKQKPNGGNLTQSNLNSGARTQPPSRKRQPAGKSAAHTAALSLGPQRIDGSPAPNWQGMNMLDQQRGQQQQQQSAHYRNQNHHHHLQLPPQQQRRPPQSAPSLRAQSSLLPTAAEHYQLRYVPPPSSGSEASKEPLVLGVCPSHTSSLGYTHTILTLPPIVMHRHRKLWHQC